MSPKQRLIASYLRLETRQTHRGKKLGYRKLEDIKSSYLKLLQVELYFQRE